jgi:hypothetical protein
MALNPGKKNIGPNIKELESTGHPYNQSLAIALKEAKTIKHKAPKYSTKTIKKSGRGM